MKLKFKVIEYITSWRLFAKRAQYKYLGFSPNIHATFRTITYTYHTLPVSSTSIKMVHILSIITLAACRITCRDGSAQVCSGDCWNVCPNHQDYIAVADVTGTDTVYYNDGAKGGPECVDREGYSLRNIAATVHHCDWRSSNPTC
jgi:hypothetical protein